MANWMDGLVLGICIINGMIAYRRGFISTLFRISSYGIGIFIAYKIYPLVSHFLRYSTGLFNVLKTKTMEVIHLESTIEQYTLQAQRNIIQHLSLPRILKVRLIENNNSEVYQILDVKGLDEYIGGYIANMLLNIISMILVCLVVFIGLKLILKTFDFFAKLPGIHFLNKLGGLFLGLAFGVVQIWIGYLVLILFYFHPKFVTIQQAIEGSLAARYLYENNILLYILAKIFY